MSGPTCIECGKTATLVSGDKIYPHRLDLHHKPYYLCQCGAYCGCHPNTTTALGSPYGPATRKARSAAHASFDPLWRSGELPRSKAYKWLADEIGIDRSSCHIGMMDEATAKRVVEVVRARSS